MYACILRKVHLDFVRIKDSMTQLKDCDSSLQSGNCLTHISSRAGPITALKIQQHPAEDMLVLSIINLTQPSSPRI